MLLLQFPERIFFLAEFEVQWYFMRSAVSPWPLWGRKQLHFKCILKKQLTVQISEVKLEIRRPQTGLKLLKLMYQRPENLK